VADADEAVAHKMNVSAVTRANVADADEAVAHMMGTRITIDPIKDEYQVIH